LILHSGHNIVSVEAAREWGTDPDADLRPIVYDMEGDVVGGEADNYLSPASIQDLDNPRQDVSRNLCAKPHQK
jgi:hypothetical protein